MMTHREEISVLESKLWGNRPHGFYEEVSPGMTKWTLFLPTIGRMFIKDREVIFFLDRT